MKQVNRLMVLAGSLATGLLFGQQALAGPYHEGEIVLFDGANYSGQSQVIDEPFERLNSVGFNDHAGSIQVLSGEWLLCRDPAFNGACLVVRRDIRDLDDFGMDDEITSIRPLPRSIRYDHGVVFERDWSGEIIFFEPDGFGGLSQVEGYSEYDRGYRDPDTRYDPYNRDRDYNDRNQVRKPYSGPRNADLVIWEDPAFKGSGLGVDRDIPALNGYDFNDIASALEIRSGKWEVCSDPYYTGRCVIFDANQTSLGAHGLNDNISSVRRIDHGAKPGSGSGNGYERDRERDRERERQDTYQKALRNADVVLFEHGNFKGRAAPVKTDMANLVSTGLNDEISSIEIRNGSWEVCEHPNFGGHCAVISASTGSLKGIKLNDNISSIRRK